LKWEKLAESGKGGCGRRRAAILLTAGNEEGKIILNNPI
jgi:hypothetical protein